MDRADLLRVFEPRGGEKFGQRAQRGVMIVVNPFDLVRHHQRAIARRILAWSHRSDIDRYGNSMTECSLAQT